jgi:transcriptional regulator NrdR family protein
MIACPSCGEDSKTLETRTVRDGDRTYERRRKACTRCSKRFTTCETIVEAGSSSNVVLVRTSTMETLLRTIASEFSPSTDGRAGELVEELLAGIAARSRKIDE